MSELVWGIKNGDLDQVKDIVEQKEIDVNKEIDGRPPLHYAADYGQADVIQYLLSKGADVNAKDKHGISALLAAIWEGHTDCVKLLLEQSGHYLLTSSHSYRLSQEGLAFTHQFQFM